MFLIIFEWFLASLLVTLKLIQENMYQYWIHCSIFYMVILFILKKARADILN